MNATGRLFTLAALLTAGLGLPAQAQDTVTAVQSGRYTMEKSGDGFVRLDTRTGAVSYCGQKNGAWACEPVSDDRQALADEIQKLETENRLLRERVGELEAQKGAAPRTEKQPELKLPSDAEMNQLMTWFETWVRRFMAFVRSLADDGQQHQSI
jgi:hypothetical protein